jgi:PAS domain S-box-containing protein
MVDVFVLGASILLQITAAFLALRLISVTGKRSAWTLISIAIMFMAVRRSITLFRLVEGSTSQPPDLLAEMVALLISILILAGISRIAPIFHSLKTLADQLRRGEEKLLQAQYISRMGNFTLELASDRVLWSDGMYRLLKYAENEEMDLHKINREVHHPEDVDRITNWLDEGIASGARNLHPNEYRLLCKDGTPIYVHTEAEVEYENGEAKRVFGTCQDITGCKQAELALQENEKLLRTITDNFPRSFVVTINRDLTVGFTGGEEFKRQGLDPRSYYGMRVAEIIRPFGDELLEKVEQAFHDTFGGTPQNFEVRMGVEYQSYATVPLPDQDGAIERILVVVQNVTERKQAEQETQRSKNFIDKVVDRYKLLAEATFEGIAITRKGEIVDVNQQVLDIFGYTRDEFIRAGLEKLIHPDDLDLALTRIMNNETEPYEPRGITKDGRIICLEVRSNNVSIDKELHRLAVIRDITDRKRADQAFRDSQERLDLAVKGTGAGLWDWDIQTGEVVFSQRWANMLGYELHEIRPHIESWRALIHRNDLKNTLAAVDAHLEGRTEFLDIAHRMRTKSGSWKWILKRGKVLQRNEQGRPVRAAGTHLDITERKEAEEALRTSEGQLSNAMKIARLAYWEYDFVNDRFIFNDHFYSILRTTAQQVGGYAMAASRYAEEFVHPDDVIVVSKEMQAAAETRDPNYSRQLEHRIIFSDGEVGFMAVRFFITKDDQGRTIKSYGANQDITERKQAERDRERLEQQVRQSQKLETIGTLAGGIAHDFNNILTPILGYADMALSNVKKDDALSSDLQEIFKGASRAKELVSQILTFSRQIERERRPLHLPLVVDDALKLLRPSIPTTIEIRKYIDPSCKKVLADPSQIHQVVVNLCTNAFQAMEETGGVLTLELVRVEVDPKTAKFHPGFKKGEYIRLKVSDTGPGMDPSTMARIFEPFFTTKPVGKGTGLGLSVVHGIVRGHQGDISVQSERGKGSTFQMYLPVMELKPAENPVDVRQVVGGDASILVVDDEPAVAGVVKRMLEQLGYAVDIQNSSVEALTTIREKSKKYDLVLTDLTMPNLTGLELAKGIRALRPELPVILMTGYGDAISDEAPDGLNIIGKPIVVRELVDIIHRVLKA